MSITNDLAPEAGTTLPGFREEITFTTVASAPVATLDYFAVHHDPNIARSQGLPDIILSTIQIMGFVDRVVTDWAGSGAFVKRRRTELRASILPGAVVHGAGVITAVDLSGPHPQVTVDVRLTDGGSTVFCKAEVTAVLTTTTTAAG
ncbi:MaoC family dehydratase [Pseudonocardia ailaonensis]|uniref:MaoC family dehydratase n=1 Tax=Pseudonocardia ailaonensis TaxID=367279 RepID=A0ABN2MHR4_9PSEU